VSISNPKNACGITGLPAGGGFVQNQQVRLWIKAQHGPASASLRVSVQQFAAGRAAEIRAGQLASSKACQSATTGPCAAGKTGRQKKSDVLVDTSGVVEICRPALGDDKAMHGCVKSCGCESVESAISPPSTSSCLAAIGEQPATKTQVAIGLANTVWGPIRPDHYSGQGNVQAPYPQGVAGHRMVAADVSRGNNRFFRPSWRLSGRRFWQLKGNGR